MARADSPAANHAAKAKTAATAQSVALALKESSLLDRDRRGPGRGQESAKSPRQRQGFVAGPAFLALPILASGRDGNGHDSILEFRRFTTSPTRVLSVPVYPYDML